MSQQFNLPIGVETHLTEAELTELWYDLCDSQGNTLPRKIGYLFPMSRKDLIVYLTQKDLDNAAHVSNQGLQEDRS